jgi:hypothetical protein
VAQLLRTLTALHLPFRAVENHQFRRLIRLLNQDAPSFSAAYIKKQLESRVINIESRILDDLPAGAKISLALDCWTSPNSLPFLAINGYFIDSEWRYREVLLGFEPLSGSHSGFNLAPILKDVLHKYDIANRVLAMTTDNASNNKTLAKHLENMLTSGNFNARGGHLPCFAHVIQLSLKELLGKIRIEATNEEVEKTWMNDSVREIDHVDGIGRTLAKVKKGYSFL